MAKTKKLTPAEELKGWTSDLSILKAKVEKSYKEKATKHKYDLIASLESAQKCVQ